MILFILFIIIFYFIYYKKYNIKIIKKNNYWLYVIDNFLSDYECNNIINKANNTKFDTSSIYEDGNKLALDNRKSLSTWIDEDIVSSRISDLLKMPKENQESLQIVKYNKGGYFLPHYDCSDDSESIVHDRIITVLIYLNDNFKGGETIFQNLDIKIKPKKGTAIIFWSKDNNNNIFEESLHSGSKILKGQKIICNKWIHKNKYIN